MTTGNRRLFLAIVLSGGVAWAIKLRVMPEYDPCPVCDGQGSLSCGAPGCDHGGVPCRGDCLKPQTPGWQRLNLAGFPPEMYFMKYDNDDGTWIAYSQRHVGDVIEKVDGRWVNKKCPICQGSGKTPCPACLGKKRCYRCFGTGQALRLF
jgi:hypothetical protein